MMSAIPLSALAKNSPKIFYLLGLVYLILQVAVPIYETHSFGYSVTLGSASANTVGILAFKLVLDAIYNASFLVAAGVSSELLLAILAKIQNSRGVE